MTESNVYPRRLLPPTGALRSFVAAAKTGSFSEAADSVGLTQSAVSRQIAQLEEQLGTDLFTRNGRRIALNAAGRAYVEEIGPALERIARASARAAQHRPPNELAIATLPSFGMRWLAPRLPRFSAAYPELVVDIAARTSVFDFAMEQFDAAIHFGLPDWPGAEHVILFGEAAIPVCSPEWLAANPVSTPADLVDKPLLFQSSRRHAWNRWFSANGVTLDAPCTGPSIEHFLMLAQTAAAGAGLALIPSFLIEPELAAGTLVSPFDLPISTDEHYYLVWPKGDRAAPGSALRCFIDWMVGEAR
ncbi:LysR substrate-binding domain-containing protein [Stakelama tenebrarum]|uniref:LysR family transcriptional regulator n=1 Tax=Stakelama tenebrarum TaxID=2711215 RepID=A0A6G6Y5N8_9SPHN|nr:LysR substrate-binding domain-containing protein [Sphingosinithalassobacter tenebrarum]QIG80161.1 LysR family transcriptional regulator [Sphingosinithalassobacter tenebrarum]